MYDFQPIKGEKNRIKDFFKALVIQKKWHKGEK